MLLSSWYSSSHLSLTFQNSRGVTSASKKILPKKPIRSPSLPANSPTFIPQGTPSMTPPPRSVFPPTPGRESNPPSMKLPDAVPGKPLNPSHMNKAGSRTLESSPESYGEPRIDARQGEQNG